MRLQILSSILSCYSLLSLEHSCSKQSNHDGFGGVRDAICSGILARLPSIWPRMIALQMAPRKQGICGSPFYASHVLPILLPSSNRLPLASELKPSTLSPSVTNQFRICGKVRILICLCSCKSEVPCLFRLCALCVSSADVSRA